MYHGSGMNFGLLSNISGDRMFVASYFFFNTHSEFLDFCFINTMLKYTSIGLAIWLSTCILSPTQLVRENESIHDLKSDILFVFFYILIPYIEDNYSCDNITAVLFNILIKNQGAQRLFLHFWSI